MIVLFGASGNVGREANRILRDAGIETRLVSRNQLDDSHAVVADYADRASLERVMQPGDRVFMVSVHEHPDTRIAWHKNFIDAAAAVGVSQLVYLSFVGASHDSAFWHARSHAATEDMLTTSNVPWTIVRTGPYSNYIPFFMLSRDVRVPAGDQPIGWVDRRDCGSLVAAVLQRDDANGQILNAIGPDLLTFEQTVQRVNTLLDTDYTFTDIDDPSALPTRGLPEWEIPSRRSFFQAMHDGEFDIRSDDIESFTGQPPRSVDVAILDAADQLKQF